MNRATVVLSWDGVRLPASRLPAKARAFLGRITTRSQFAKMLREGGPIELRICWVPRLLGGTNVLVPPFPAPAGKRIPFQIVKTVSFGDALGIVYRTAPPVAAAVRVKSRA